MARDMTSKRNKVFVALSLLYIGFLYGSSGIMRGVQAWTRHALGDWFSLLINLTIAGAVMLFIYCYRKKFRAFRVRQTIIILSVIAGYILACRVLTIPEERIHLVEYGLLAWLVTESFRGSISIRNTHIYAFLLVALVGVGDEAIQWLRPNRVGDFRDILLNWFAAAMAQTMILVTVDYKPKCKNVSMR